jgi:hypothetical protein
MDEDMGCSHWTDFRYQAVRGKSYLVSFQSKFFNYFPTKYKAKENTRV